jgi:hypothetical protein
MKAPSRTQTSNWDENLDTFCGIRTLKLRLTSRTLYPRATAAGTVIKLEQICFIKLVPVFNVLKVELKLAIKIFLSDTKSISSNDLHFFYPNALANC